MSPCLSFDELESSLKEEDSFIKELIDTIPPKMYFDRDLREKIVAEKHAHMDEAVKGLQGGSFIHKGASAKLKHKRARLDPQCQKSVSQIQEEISEQASKKAKKKVTFKSPTLLRAENVEELQKRLQEKVMELQAKRRGYSAQEFLERKQLKKENKKLKKESLKRKRLEKEGVKVGKGNENSSISKATVPSSKTQNDEHQKPVKKPNSKHVYNKDGKVIFGKFEFLETGFETKKERMFSGKNYKKLLDNVEKDKEKISKLREQDAKQADEMVHKKAWKRAIEKAEGIKVKDNPALLKKSLMKQEKKKRKSAKVWKEREDQAENKKKMRQEKRQKNIQNKKKEKLQAKLKRAKKKGRIIPGF